MCVYGIVNLTRSRAHKLSNITKRVIFALSVGVFEGEIKGVSNTHKDGLFNILLFKCVCVCYKLFPFCWLCLIYLYPHKCVIYLQTRKFWIRGITVRMYAQVYILYFVSCKRLSKKPKYLLVFFLI